MILVTGATGKTGASVVRELQKKGVPFRAMARDVEKAQAMFGDGVAVVHGEMTDDWGVDPAMEDVRTLFLLTPPDEEMLALNHNTIVAAQREAIGHIVKLSAIGADHDSPLQLGRWHAAVEQQVVESELAYTFLRAGSFMQNFFNHIPTVREQGQVFSANGDGKIAMIDTRDIAEIVADILANPTPHDTNTYTLTGGEAITDADATAELSRALGREISYTEISTDDAKAAMARFGMQDWLVDDLGMLSDMAKAGHMAEVSPDTERLLGRAPRTFAEFAEDHKELFGG